MKSKTKREHILDMFNKETFLSCDQVTKSIIKSERRKPTKTNRDDVWAGYLSGSVTSLLRRMVVSGVLRYADHKTKRGGHIYQLNQLNKI